MSCTESLNGKHEAEEAEVESVDAGETTLVFYCIHCGVEGRLVVKNSRIKWEVDAEVEDDDDGDWDEDDDLMEEAEEYEED